MGTKTLPSFSYHWISGDIQGLQELDDQCQQAASRIDEASQALTHQVSSVVGAGGWTGKAADSFTAAWDKDSRAGAQLADAWRKTGSIASTLAVDLASLESALEEAACQLEKQGIPVDVSTGLPAPDSTMSGNASPSPAALATRSKLASGYMAFREKMLKAATEARAHATYSLYTVTSEVLPPQYDSGQLANDLDSVRNLWAIPTELRSGLEEGLGETAKVRDQLWLQAIASKKEQGINFRLPRDLVEKGASARLETAKLEGRLANAPQESKLTQLADGDADALGAVGAAGKLIKGVPYAGAGAGAVIQIVQDRENHESWTHSVADGVVSNGAGLGVGLGVAALAGTTSVAAVAGGAIIGGVAAVGIGDGVHNLIQENWSADIHKHGVLDGIGHGVADSFDKTRHDMAHYGDDIIHIF